MEEKSKVEKPYFSIIIPCYNQALYLSKAIDSILSQSFQDWEVIIINDGSTDQTQLVAESFKISDKRVFVVNQSNKGLSAARNTGVALAKGQVINFLDADDWLLNNCLQIVFDHFLKYKYDVLVTGFTYFKESSPIHSHFFSFQEISISRLIEGNIAPPVAFFVKNNVVKVVGDFDVTLKGCEDWDYWIRIGKFGFRFFSIRDILVAYRYVPNSMSRNPWKMYEALLIVSERARSMDYRISMDAFLNRNYDLDVSLQAKAHFIRCLGVSLYQRKLGESLAWYVEEKNKFGWKFEKQDWIGLSSNLSFRYFLSPTDIQQVLNITRPVVSDFFRAIGYSQSENSDILSIVFAPQLKKRNHLKYGKLVGGILNKLGIWK